MEGGETVTTTRATEFEEVPVGKNHGDHQGKGFTTISTEETVEEGKHLEVKYTVTPKEEKPGEEAADEEMVIVAPRIKKEVLSTTIKVEEGKRVPGTLGDTLKVVQNLPGVGRAAFSSGALVVWGALPQDTRVYVDGVRVPLSRRWSRSTINLIRCAPSIQPGGYGAEYGRGPRGLSRSIRVHRAPMPPRLRRGRRHRCIGNGRSTARRFNPRRIAGRQSYLNHTLQLYSSEDVGDFVPIPTYYDAQLKVEHDLGQNQSLQVFGLTSHDTLTRTVTNTDPAQVKRLETLAAFSRVMVRYRRQFEDGFADRQPPSA